MAVGSGGERRKAERVQDMAEREPGRTGPTWALSGEGAAGEESGEC